MKTLAFPLTLLALGILVLAGVLLFKPISTTFGAAFPGTAAYLQSATTTEIGPQDVTDTIFSAKTDGSCKSRVITTGGTGITITFGDAINSGISSTTLSETVGHWQAPSTTVIYDSGLTGCGRWSAFSLATQTITVSEF